MWLPLITMTAFTKCGCWKCGLAMLSASSSATWMLSSRPLWATRSPSGLRNKMAPTAPDLHPVWASVYYLFMFFYFFFFFWGTLFKKKNEIVIFFLRDFIHKKKWNCDFFLRDFINKKKKWNCDFFLRDFIHKKKWNCDFFFEGL